MRYMMLIYTDENAAAEMSPQEKEKVQIAHGDLMAEAKKQNAFRAAEPLHPTSSATTVRVQSGKPLISDGPFAETKEQLGGYYILDCKDLDEAIEWAAKIPTARGNRPGCVEIRPLREIPPRPKTFQPSLTPQSP